MAVASPFFNEENVTPSVVSGMTGISYSDMPVAGAVGWSKQHVRITAEKSE